MQQTWLKFGLVSLLVALVVVWTILMMKPEQNATMSYKITTPLQKVTLDDVEDLIWPYLVSGFWEADLVSLQRDLQAQPWIESAQVSRVWPNQLVLTLDEREPIARWGTTALIDRNGFVFEPNDVAGFEHLVLLQAHDLQARAMLRHWHQVQEIMSPKDWRVTELTWFADDVLHIQVDVGHQLYVTASDKDLLLRRFVNAWPKLGSSALVTQGVGRAVIKPDKMWQIDLRYSNGIALKPLNNVD
ncbi:cell division protein FtsQ/DivIB [Thiomicrospira cyclica]|uniref:Polypeptide-transport-associated domain protein FtsQ-type n=1 Tax=Thiomicrospira cyclica (strain DSM 14477 / JCM 11371 / ALM1) TaxID=717773 RepID=F6D9M0_THICA|nr:FtsQ-type POTRA domain-containing protein [Thiomicrospira cyclica]AEG30977.1 Polypeptide-transport-associated domain protein FtsQ-type [Thiomicrospira cyclica ALM1]